MNSYTVCLAVSFGENRWFSVHADIKTAHSLVAGMIFTSEPIVRSPIESTEYDAGRDEVVVELARMDHPGISSFEQMESLRQEFAAAGWKFIEGLWDDEFLVPEAGSLAMEPLLECLAAIQREIAARQSTAPAPTTPQP